MELRDYQIKQLSEITESARQHKRILAQAPCGSGKSALFADLIRRAHDKGKMALFLVHRRELIAQADRHLSRVGLRCGMIMAGEHYAPGVDVQLGSIQTVHRRKDRLDFSRYSLVIVDESHRIAARTYQEVLAKMNGAHVIGFTATPIRNGGTPLGEIFDALVLGPKVQDLIDQGYLAAVDYMGPSIPDMRGVKTVSGDYSPKDVEGKVVPKLIGGVVDHYLKYGGKKGIVFSCSIKHSNYLHDEFNARGRESLVIDSTTPEDERSALLRQFVESDKSILINCMLFTEGFDSPECDTLVLARPTKSLGLFLQMTGRGMRPKPDGGRLLVIDHGANVYRHGFMEDERDWSLVTQDEKTAMAQSQSDRVKKYATCSNCGAMVVGRKCPCGAEITPTRRAQNVRELKQCGLVILKREPRRGVGVHAIAAIQKRAGTPKEWINLVKWAALKGFRIGFAAHQWKAKYGGWPPQNFGALVPRGKEQWGVTAARWLEVMEQQLR